MNTTRKVAIGAVLVGGSLVGGAIGATLVGAAGAQSPSTTTVTVDPGAATTKHYNTDPAHEATESPEREAAEVAGTAEGGDGHPEGHDHGHGFGHGDGHSNTDPAHEAGESPERQAEEAAHDAQVTTTTAG